MGIAFFYSLLLLVLPHFRQPSREIADHTALLLFPELLTIKACQAKGKDLRCHSHDYLGQSRMTECFKQHCPRYEDESHRPIKQTATDNSS